MHTTPVIQQYLEIKASHQDSLLFFRMGDFYELFFSDAEIASDALNIILTKRGQHNGKDIPMCGVPFHSAEGYIKTLLDKNMKVAICEQLETPKEAKKRGYKEIVKRDVVRIITPGTKLEESFLVQKENNILMALFFFDNIWASCWIDISTGLFKSTISNESQLLSLIDQVSPKETISYANKKELSILKSYTPIEITWLERKKTLSRDILIDYLSSFFDPERLQKLNTGLLGSISLLVEYLKKNKRYVESLELFLQAKKLVTSFAYEIPGLNVSIAECHIGLKNYELAESLLVNNLKSTFKRPAEQFVAEDLERRVLSATSRLVSTVSHERCLALHLKRVCADARAQGRTRMGSEHRGGRGVRLR